MIIFLVPLSFFVVPIHTTSISNYTCIQNEKYECDNKGYQKFQYCNKTPFVKDDNKVKCDCFIYNCDRIKEFKRNQRRNDILFDVKLNKFADKCEDEFFENFLSTRINVANNGKECRTDIPPFDSEIPKSMDWVAKGAVTSIVDQGGCKSSWAFSAAGVLEAYRVIKLNKTLEKLSAQNLIDCSKPFGNDGCFGGDLIKAFEYIRAMNGIDTDSDYPYKAKESNECLHHKSNSSQVVAQDFRCLIKGDEEELKKLVSKYGPVAVSVDAQKWDFRFYNSGIYHSDECCNFAHCLNHAMLVVGYGNQAGTDYWLVKNTWGESWGEKGYMKLARNLNNTCGIATSGFFLV